MATLRGKTLFISGASRGIGLAIALRAARDGANVAIAAKTDQPHPSLPGTIHTAAAEVEAAGGQALAVVCDIREEAQVAAAVAATVARFGGIDICVNNASAISLTPILATPMKRFDLMHGVNARGTYLVTQQCLPAQGSQSACADALTALGDAGALVRPARGLHDGQVRHEHGGAGRGR